MDEKKQHLGITGLMRRGWEAVTGRGRSVAESVQGAVGTGNNLANEQSVAVGGHVNGGIHTYHVYTSISGDAFWGFQKKPSPDLNAATGAYLAALFERYRLLELKGLGFSDGVALQLPLTEHYIPLKARRQQPKGETWSRELTVAGRKAGPEEQEVLGERLSRPMPLMDVLREASGLIVLGDPGSGKTTFLKYLCLKLAAGQGEELGLDGYLPVLVPLSAYAQEGDGMTLEHFIPNYYGKSICGDHPLDLMLKTALAEGRALLLLDGLDEVRDPARRRGVVDGVENFFAAQKAKGNRFVLTSRIIGYREVQPRQIGLAECCLIDFDKDEIHAFIEKWTKAIEQAQTGVSKEQAAKKAEEERTGLFRALEHSEGVRRLAANPLLLTILCLMKRQGVELPERRVDLYQEYVKTLISSWNLARGVRRPDHAPPDFRETLKVLAPLALWMQRTSPGVGLVKEPALYRELERIIGEKNPACDAETEARRFIDDLRAETALLLDRGGNLFGFIHLTFQEYLAAVAIARQGQESTDPIYSVLVEALPNAAWREVWLLTLAHLSFIQGREEATSGLVRRLLAEKPGEPGAALVRVGEALNDMGKAGVTQDCWEETRKALEAGLAASAIPAKPRARCGRLLGDLGETRPEVLDPDAMPFCWVPPGPFFMGSDDDPDAYDDEKPSYLQKVDYGYWLARWPVTTAQFRMFVEAEGYQKHHPDSLKGPPGAPAAYVSWHDAVAFCRWLDRRWTEKGLLPKGYRVGLPSELEWEKAARGGEKVVEHPVTFAVTDLQSPDADQPNAETRRRYPWGDQPDLERANYAMHIGEVSPIGCYPGGASPCGCEELSGNVWEWTRSLWRDYPYPWDEPERRRREDMTSSERRVLRGGAFSYGTRGVRCAFRNYDVPDIRNYNFGFRVVLSPFTLNSEASGL